MVFGFAMAVISGFLLTAVNRWTGRETAAGGALAGLCAIWLVGRVAMLCSANLAAAWVAAVDLAFIPALAFFIARPIFQSGNRRNLKFLIIFGLLFAANLAMHLGAMGVLSGVARPALLVGLDLIIVITLIISGRVIPMFTRNATGAAGIRSHPRSEKLVFALVLSSMALHAILPGGQVGAVVALLAGLAIAARQFHWGCRHTLGAPILWVLHLGHAWIAVGFILRALATWLPQVAPTMSTHALTVGGLGMLIIGMMVRVALGHTARMLKASRLMTAAFAAVTLAAAGRTFLPILWPAYYINWVVLSGTLFALAFLAYAVEFAPVLLKPRADGAPG
jgi:uncharacterized protein involved in response to NO